MNKLKKLLIKNFPDSEITNARLLNGMEEHYYLDGKTSIIKWDETMYCGSYEYAIWPFNVSFHVINEKVLIRRLKNRFK